MTSRSSLVSTTCSSLQTLRVRKLQCSCTRWEHSCEGESHSVPAFWRSFASSADIWPLVGSRWVKAGALPNQPRLRGIGAPHDSELTWVPDPSQDARCMFAATPSFSQNITRQENIFEISQKSLELHMQRNELDFMFFYEFWEKKTARQLLKRLNMFTFFQWNRMFPGTGRRKTTRNNKEMLRFETEKEGEEDDCNQHWWRGPGLRTLSELSFGLQKDPEPDVRKILVWQLELHRCSVKTRSDLRNWRLNVYSSQKKPTSKQSHTCFQSVMWSTPTPLTEPFQTCQTEVKMTGFYQSKDFFSVCSWQISPQSCWGWYLLGLWLLIHWES